MTGCAPKWRLFLFLLAGLLLAGCSQLRRSGVEEEKEPHFLEGKKRFSRADWDGAIASYERAVQVNPQNATAHYELGVLYDTKKNDYISALYNYQRHLLMRTNSPMANVVQEYMKACSRELSKTVQYAVLTRDVQRDLERYEQTNSFLKKRVESLEAEIARRPQYITNYVTNIVALPQVNQRSSGLTQTTLPVNTPEPSIPESQTNSRRNTTKPTVQKPSSTRRETTPPSTTSPATAHTAHKVRPGETLASLAARYGVSVQALRTANPGAANGVRAGQTITIPR